MATSSKESGSTIFRFLPLSIRLETLGGIATPLVLRGTPLPTKRVETFSTASDNQTRVEVKLLIGESSLSEKCRVLGTFYFGSIPPAPKAQPQIKLVFGVERDCSIRVKANLEGTIIEAEASFDPPSELLSPESIEALRAEADSSRKEDEQKVSLIEARAAGENAIKKAEEKLQGKYEGKTIVSDPDALKRAIATLGQALETEDAGQIREATQGLNSRVGSGFDFDSLFGAAAFDDIFAKQPSRLSQKPLDKKVNKKSHAPKSSPAKPATDVATAVPKDSSLGRIFGGGEFTLDSNLCFILMPFEETFQPIYEDHIRPTIQAQGLTCMRADDIRGTTLITRDIWEKINRARFLVADLSGQNPNVFYEVGLAHALGKDVLLLTQTMTDVPFDLKALRCIVYSYTPRGMKEMEAALKATISALMKSG